MCSNFSDIADEAATRNTHPEMHAHCHCNGFWIYLVILLLPDFSPAMCFTCCQTNSVSVLMAKIQEVQGKDMQVVSTRM